MYVVLSGLSLIVRRKVEIILKRVNYNISNSNIIVYIFTTDARV